METRPSRPRTTVAILSTCYALSLSSVSLAVAIAPLVGLALAPKASLATVPLSLGILTTMAVTFPASLLMGRIGRRAGLWVGSGIGAVGTLLAVAGITSGSFVLFCAGSMGIGALNGFAQYYRFAAADVAPDAWKARAISYVLAGGVLAGVLGPFLARNGAHLVVDARFAGSYASLLVLHAIIAVLLLWVRLPPPPAIAVRGTPRALGRIVRRPLFVVAVGMAMIAYGVMSLIMTATPLVMRAQGHSLASGALVIQAHVVAMFAPSFFSGALLQRWGPLRMGVLGFVGLAATPLVALSGTSVPHHAAALILLGIGWNFLFVTGTTLVTTLHTPSEKAKVQGFNDLLVFGTAAAGSFLAGALQQTVGGAAVHRGLLPVLLLAGGTLLSVAWWHHRARPDPNVPVPVPPL